MKIKSIIYVAILTAILLTTFKRELDYQRIAGELAQCKKMVREISKDADELRWINVELEDYMHAKKN